MINPIFCPIILPFIFGLLILGLPSRWAKGTALVGSGFNLLVCALLFAWKPLSYTGLGSHPLLILDTLPASILLFQAIFGVLAVLYSPAYLSKNIPVKEYYAYFLWALAGTAGTISAGHLLIFLIFWNILGLVLYLLLNLSPTEKAAASAKKTLIILGGTDSLFILGFAIIFFLTGRLYFEGMPIRLENGLAYLAFFSLVSAAFAKAGAFPFHTWLPEIAEPTPAPILAFLPASLDKLVGIYFLFRICQSIFSLSFPAQTILLALGAATIIFAVMMALVQHNFKKLLAYHAVSQVGYMVVGIATNNPLGIAGGLFHMFNNAIYKQGLFFAGGNVEKITGSTEIEDLGNLGPKMRWTFLSFLVLSLAIAGVPPLNGFYSKWLIYQGLVEMGQNGNKLWLVWITAAMFGSVLTLASFMKLIHAIFLGMPAYAKKKITEAPVSMLIPPVFLAILCIIFGVLAYRFPLPKFILPAVGSVNIIGLWHPGMATFLILVGLVLGLFLFGIGRLKKIRLTPIYTGGEPADLHFRPTGKTFYETIREVGFIRTIYRLAEEKLFDIYEIGKEFVFTVSEGLRKMHNGILPNYLSWVIGGLVILLWVMGGF